MSIEFLEQPGKVMFITVKYGGRFNFLRQDLLLWHLLLKFKSSTHSHFSSEVMFGDIKLRSHDRGLV